MHYTQEQILTGYVSNLLTFKLKSHENQHGLSTLSKAYFESKYKEVQVVHM